MNIRSLFTWLFLTGGIVVFAQGLYIPTKALFAQHLLEEAWQDTLHGKQQARPWSWADTWPVARLQQPRLGIDQIVLAGASGRVLAFGPGHVRPSALPGKAGNTVISGHRDTHFRWLAKLRDGDLIELQSADGQRWRYAVDRRAVHNEGDGYLLNPEAFQGLRLITCYPFDGVNPGTNLRYVVEARLVEPCAGGSRSVTM